MGHRKSHKRASRGTPEVLSVHPKDKHDTHECGSKAGGRSRRDKRNHKRKREHEDVSKRRRKERHRGSHCSSKSSSKGKARDKVRKWEDGESSKSDSSSSFMSSKGGQRGSSIHSRDSDVLRKRARSPIADVRQEDHKKHISKRMKRDKEAFSGSPEHCDGLIERLRSEKEVVHKCVDPDLEKVGQYMRSSSSSKLTRSERGRSENTITTSEEQEMGLEGREDNGLEDELRQKALANFLRHHDASWKTDEHGHILDSEIRRLATCNDQDERVVGELDSRSLPVVGNAVNVDAHWWPSASDTVTLADVKHLAQESDNNLEEGEIESDTCIENETEKENASSIDKVLHEKGSNLERKPHSIRNNCEKEHHSRISSGEKIERVSMPAPHVDKKQELSQEQAVKDSPDVDLASASAQRDSNFQEKTMSVMRGGEVVQVSYKVYIPKRAAELARRRLQR